MTEHLDDDLYNFVATPERLDPSTRARLAAHVDGCATCRGAVDDTRRLFGALDAAPSLGATVEPSRGFRAAMNARLDAIDEARGTPWARLRAWLTSGRVALGGALAAGALGAALTLTPRAETPGELAAVAELDPGVSALDVAEHLELLEDLDVVEDLDIVDDLDVLTRLAADREG
jgi:hypothetical protein